MWCGIGYEKTTLLVLVFLCQYNFFSLVFSSSVLYTFFLLNKKSFLIRTSFLQALLKID